MADSGICGLNSMTHFGVDSDKVVLLLAKALKQGDADIFLDVYDNFLPKDLPSEEINHLKEKARQVAELPVKDFDALVASLDLETGHQAVGNFKGQPQTEIVSCHMAATEAAAGTNVVQADGKVKDAETSPLNSDDSAATEDSLNEATVSETIKNRTCGSAITEEKSTSNSLKLKNSIPTNKVSKIVTVESKETDGKKKGESQVRTNSLERDARHRNDVIGATLSFGLGQNSVVKTSAQKQEPVEKKSNLPVQPPKMNSTSSSSSADRNKTDSLSGSPHSPEDLLEKAADLVDKSACPKSSTCPAPKFLDPCDHSDAVALNYVSGERTMGHRSDSSPEDSAQPVEREMQPLSKKEDDRELEGLFNRKHPKNYGSLDCPDNVVSPVVNSVSSPDEETSAAANSAAESREVLVESVGPETAEGAAKKKKKKKKKKKGNPEGDPGGAANSSDHENKVVTSPGTSGTEDSNKPSTGDNPPPPLSKQKPQTQTNGPSATQPKSSTLSSKNKKVDGGVKKQANNSKKLSETAADESKTISKSDKGGAKSSVKADRPKSLDLSSKIDSERTTSQPANDKKATEKPSKAESENLNAKAENTSDNESESGNDAEKSSEDTSVKASQESSMDENFQEDDDSNGSEWQTYGQKKNKRRAHAAEDRYNLTRPSHMDYIRRTHGYSGPFDPRLRKSSSEPSGMSKWMDVSDSRPVHRHSSFSRNNQYLREEFHSYTTKTENEPVERAQVPVPSNSYAAKLKAKPPVAPSSVKKSQDKVASVVDGQDSSSKEEDNKIAPSASSSDSGDKKDPPEPSMEIINSVEPKPSPSNASSQESRSMLEGSNEQLDTTDKQLSVVSDITAAKSASLPRDMGRKPGTELPKMDNNADNHNVVQYLDLQCDTYASRLKQSINKSDAKSAARISNTKQENPVSSETTKPPRTSMLESSHKAQSLDSAQPVPAVAPKKANIGSAKDKDTMRTVKSETSLNLTSEGTPVVQDNSFPFAAEPAASFDITFGSVKFSESDDFELLDDVMHGNQQPKNESDAKLVPQPATEDRPDRKAGAKSPSPPPNQVSCAELEKAWISKSSQSNSKTYNQDAKSAKGSSSSSVPSVPPDLAAILSSGGTNNTPVNTKLADNNNVKKGSSQQRFHQPSWTNKFNHSELADMLQKDWENLHCELSKQSSKVVIYEED